MLLEITAPSLCRACERLLPVGLLSTPPPLRSNENVMKKRLTCWHFPPLLRSSLETQALWTAAKEHFILPFNPWVDVPVHICSHGLSVHQDSLLFSDLSVTGKYSTLWATIWSSEHSERRLHIGSVINITWQPSTVVGHCPILNQNCQNCPEQ